jgi:hypothetical protein
MDERTRTRLMIVISALVILGSVTMILLVEGFRTWTMALFLVVVILALVALFLVMRSLKEIRSGFPLQDERSRALGARAGRFSFYASLYLTLALAFAFAVLGDRGVEVPNSELLFVLVAMMGSIHIVASTYYARKGTREPG